MALLDKVLMELTIQPLRSFGRVEFGMHRKEVRRILQVEAQPFKKSPLALVPTDAFDQLGLHVYYDVRHQVEFVEAFQVPAARVVFDGYDIFSTPGSELIQRLRSQHEVVEEDPGASYLLPELELSLWRPAAPAPDETDRFEAVGAGRLGYFSAGAP